MDRIHMSGNVPADIAERLSDQPVDVTDATEDEAITAIIEDFLLLGEMYPRNGRRAITAGDIVQECATEEQQRQMFDALVYDGRDGMMLYDAQQNAIQIVKEEGPKYLRQHRHDLIELMQDEMSGEEA